MFGQVRACMRAWSLRAGRPAGAPLLTLQVGLGSGYDGVQVRDLGMMECRSGIWV